MVRRVSVSDGERMAIMETKIENISVKLNSMDAKLDALPETIANTYVSRSEYDSFKRIVSFVGGAVTVAIIGVTVKFIFGV